MLTGKRILGEIETASEDLNILGVKRIGIFGSFANNTQTKKSDIDFIVEFNKGSKTFDNYMDLKIILEDKFKRRVDLVLKDSLKETIKSKVLKDTMYARL